MDILGYWKDSRFNNISDLVTNINNAASSSLVIKYTVKKSFEDNGYETYRWESAAGPGGEISQIKKFVNSSKKIPVLIYQRRSLDESNLPPDWRLVIGIFDHDKKVIVHDYYFGNNYEISYENFEKMFDKDGAILAVWPSDKIKGVIKGPNYSLLYPQRTEAMGKLGPLALRLPEIALYVRAGDFEKAATSYKKLVDDPSFEYFPPAFRVFILSSYASDRIALKQYDEAINLINERVLPLNQNLNKAPEGWFVPYIDRSEYPYFILNIAYFWKGEKNLATSYYKEAASLYELNKKTFTLPQIEEIEKEISSKK